MYCFAFANKYLNIMPLCTVRDTLYIVSFHTERRRMPICTTLVCANMRDYRGVIICNINSGRGGGGLRGLRRTLLPLICIWLYIPMHTMIYDPPAVIYAKHVTGADPGFFPRGGPAGHSAPTTPQTGKVRRGVCIWSALGAILSKPQAH